LDRSCRAGRWRPVDCRRRLWGRLCGRPGDGDLGDRRRGHSAGRAADLEELRALGVPEVVSVLTSVGVGLCTQRRGAVGRACGGLCCDIGDVVVDPVIAGRPRGCRGSSECWRRGRADGGLTCVMPRFVRLKRLIRRWRGQVEVARLTGAMSWGFGAVGRRYESGVGTDRRVMRAARLAGVMPGGVGTVGPGDAVRCRQRLPG